jgi:hypothetical protein
MDTVVICLIVTTTALITWKLTKIRNGLISETTGNRRTSSQYIGNDDFDTEFNGQLYENIGTPLLLAPRPVEDEKSFEDRLYDDVNN